MNLCHYCNGAVPDLPGLDPDRAHCSTRCQERAVVDAERRLLKEIVR